MDTIGQGIWHKLKKPLAPGTISQSKGPKGKLAQMAGQASHKSLSHKMVPTQNKRHTSGGSGDSALRRLSNKLDRKHFPNITDFDSIRKKGKGVKVVEDVVKRLKHK